MNVMENDKRLSATDGRVSVNEDWKCFLKREHSQLLEDKREFQEREKDTFIQQSLKNLAASYRHFRELIRMNMTDAEITSVIQEERERKNLKVIRFSTSQNQSF